MSDSPAIQELTQVREQLEAEEQASFALTISRDEAWAEIKQVREQLATMTQELEAVKSAMASEYEMDMNTQIRLVVDLRGQLATMTHLKDEALRAWTELTQQLATACQIIRDGFEVVPITAADVAWATEAIAKKGQP